MINEPNIPDWVISVLRTKIMHRWTGGVTIMFSDGGIRNVHKETEVQHPPRKESLPYGVQGQQGQKRQS